MNGGLGNHVLESVSFRLDTNVEKLFIKVHLESHCY